MASVRSIANRLGVSVATVSRALNDKPNVNPETRRMVLEEAQRVGYVLDSRLSSRRVIAVGYTWDPGRVDYGGFDAALMRGILQGVNEQRFDVIIIDIHRDKHPDEDYRSFFRRKGINGVILRTNFETRDICEAIAREGVPSIVVADRYENARVNFIASESRTQSRKAIEHLLHLGHRRIGLCVHHVRDTDHQDRLEGYKEGLIKSGIEFDPSLVVEVVADMEGGASGMRYLMSLTNKPTAVYFTDPLATIGALQRCHELGVHVPQDLSIVGFDDSDVRQHCFPPFTAVCQNASRLGFEAARWLTRHLNDRSNGATLHKLLPTTFEINQTSGPAPSEA